MELIQIYKITKQEATIFGLISFKYNMNYHFPWFP